MIMTVQSLNNEEIWELTSILRNTNAGAVEWPYAMLCARRITARFPNVPRQEIERVINYEEKNYFLKNGYNLLKLRRKLASIHPQFKTGGPSEAQKPGPKLALVKAGGEA
jgi:hypothetical protein